MSSFDRVIFVSSWIFVILTGQLLLVVIRKYHQNKPLGMQTLLGKVIVIFVHTLAISGGVLESSVCATEVFGPIKSRMTIIRWFLETVLVEAFYIALLAMMATKYLLIYHGAYMSEVNEEAYLKRLKIILLTLPIALALLEATLISDLEDLITYQQMYNGQVENDAKIETTTISLFSLSFLGLMSMQARIEFDAYQSQDGQGSALSKFISCCKNCQAQSNISNNQDAGYAIKVARITVLLGFMLVVIVIIQLAGGAENTKWNQLYFSAILTNVMPILFIYNHSQMKKTAWKEISNLICC